jgi:predicted TIM-barrel fold metal-dependent hydrolase
VISGIWYLQMMFPQAVQQAFSTFFLHGTFDRFPHLKLVILESGASWLGFWMDRMDALYKSPLRVTLELKDLPSTYVRQQCWISADPDERALPPILEYVGADRFLWATDYPHSDHGANYMEELRELGEKLPSDARRRLFGANVAELYRLA